MGCAPSTTHEVVLTTRLFTLNSHEGSLHSWITCSLLGTVRSHLQTMSPQLGTEVFPPMHWCLQLLTQWSPPAAWAPSTARGGDSTLGPLTLNWAWRGPDPLETHRWVLTRGPGVLSCTGSCPDLRLAVHPQFPRKESPAAACTPSTLRGGPPAEHSNAHVGAP